MHPDPELKTKVKAINEILSFAFLTLEFILGLRVIFKLFHANFKTPVVRFILEITSIFEFPFHNLFPQLQQAPAVEDATSTIFSMVIYAFIGFGILFVARVIEELIKSRGVK